MAGFSPDERKLVDKLIKAGIQKNEAKVLVSFADEETTTRGDIENRTGLSQPEISIAVQGLREKGWVLKTGKKTEGNRKGRPVHLYSLSKDFPEILEDLEEEIKKKIQKKEKNIQAIKELLEEIF